MVDWRLIRRCGLRYTVGYAGVTVVAVGGFTRSSLALLGLVALALLLLLFVAGGTGSVRMGTAMTNADAMGYDSAVADPAEEGLQASAMAADVKLLFYAVGLLVFGFAGLVAVG